MDEPLFPSSAGALRKRLVRLRERRRQRNVARRSAGGIRRRSLRPSDRTHVLNKTAGRCHICGGTVVAHWQADHVLAHSGGGPHSIENYLAAHALCNNYRWDYGPEEFQWVLKIGVWARLQMESGSPIGMTMLKGFFGYEVRRHRRRRAR